MISEKIEIQAEETLSKLNIKGTPIPIEEVATRLQLKISRAPSNDFSGMLIRKDGHALIGVNSSEGTLRQRFTIAHEIGHFLLHPLKDTFVDYRHETKKDTPKPPKEFEADAFAAALLMPRKNIVKDFNAIAKGLNDNEIKTVLANRYQVSEEAMQYRLKNLGLFFVIQ